MSGKTLQIHLDDAMRTRAEAGHFNFIDRIRAAAEGKGWQVQILPETTEPPAPGHFALHHMTGPLHLVQPPLQDVVEDVAQQFFADLPPQHIDSLALFSQKHPQDDFVLLDHFELAPAPALSLTTP